MRLPIGAWYPACGLADQDPLVLSFDLGLRLLGLHDEQRVSEGDLGAVGDEPLDEGHVVFVHAELRHDHLDDHSRPRWCNSARSASPVRWRCASRIVSAVVAVRGHTRVVQLVVLLVGDIDRRATGQSDVAVGDPPQLLEQAPDLVRCTPAAAPPVELPVRRRELDSAGPLLGGDERVVGRCQAARSSSLHRVDGAVRRRVGSRMRRRS